MADSHRPMLPGEWPGGGAPRSAVAEVDHVAVLQETGGRRRGELPRGRLGAASGDGIEEERADVVPGPAVDAQGGVAVGRRVHCGPASGGQLARFEAVDRPPVELCMPPMWSACERVATANSSVPASRSTTARSGVRPSDVSTTRSTSRPSTCQTLQRRNRWIYVRHERDAVAHPLDHPPRVGDRQSSQVHHVSHRRRPEAARRPLRRRRRTGAARRSRGGRRPVRGRRGRGRGAPTGSPGCSPSRRHRARPPRRRTTAAPPRTAPPTRRRGRPGCPDAAGHHQDVALEHRADVEERHDAGLVDHDLGGQVAGDDRPEGATGHARQPRTVSSR